MIKYLKKWFTNFGRPESMPSNTKNLINIDRKLNKIDMEQRELRMKLLNIQGSPRGSIHG